MPPPDDRAPTAARAADGDPRAALHALLADADAFGVLGWGTPVGRPPVAVAAVAATGSAAVAGMPAGAGPPRAETGTAAAGGPGPDTLEALAGEIRACRACGLGALRTHAVPGDGPATARLMFVGEAPGFHEDQSGMPFVGAAGELLTKMIGAMGFARDEVFIANVLKCRPPENRDPAPAEVAACRSFLDRQLALVRPAVIVALGGHAARTLLKVEGPVAGMRGRVHRVAGTDLVVTYHPSYLLQNPAEKKKAWEDLQLAMRVLRGAAP